MKTVPTPRKSKGKVQVTRIGVKFQPFRENLRIASCLYEVEM